MDIKRLITHFTYRIEQKPEGGFVAHASDPNLPPIEAPTRMELQHKIQDSINAALATEFPGLKLPENKRVSFHLERQADGGVAFHSSDPNAPNSGLSTHEEVENHFAVPAGACRDTWCDVPVSAVASLSEVFEL